MGNAGVKPFGEDAAAILAKPHTETFGPVETATFAAGELCVHARERICAYVMRAHMCVQQRLGLRFYCTGCFWGVELSFQRVPGVLSTKVGYTGGFVEKPVSCA
jgi:hypothetical protein